jgi:hypothetical protein
MLIRHFKRWRIALESASIVVVLIIIKVVVENLGLEFVTINPLFTSIIAGGIFLFGLILAGTLADYKESEKIPAEIISACESIYEEGCYVKETRPEFDLEALVATLNEVVDGFYSDTVDVKARTAFTALSKLSQSFLEMEQLGVPPNYITRLKAEASLIRKNILRVYYIQRTDFLPSAYILVQSIVALIMILLVFTKIEPFHDAIIIIFFLTYLFVYILKLLRTLDQPFQKSGTTMDDVSLFLLHEFKERIGKQ